MNCAMHTYIYIVHTCAHVCNMYSCIILYWENDFILYVYIILKLFYILFVNKQC